MSHLYVERSQSFAPQISAGYHGDRGDVAVVLGWMFLGFHAGWILSSMGWKQLGYSATVAGLSLLYFTIPIGIIVAVIVRCKLSPTRLPEQSAWPNMNSR